MRKNVAIAMLAITAAALLSGCASAKKIKGPDGRDTYSVKCDGMAVSIETCYEKAAEVCPSGYEIVDKHATFNNLKKGLLIACK